LVDFVARVVRPAPGTVRATISLPNCTAQLVRAGGPSGRRQPQRRPHAWRRVLTRSPPHGRLLTALSRHADSLVLVVNYRMI
jgi:hypothetical protein